MSTAILLDAALSSILFLGCEAAAIDQSNILAAGSSDLAQCKEYVEAIGSARGLPAPSATELCHAEPSQNQTDQNQRGQSSSGGFSGQNLGGQLVGQGGKIGSSIGDPRGGPVGAAQPDPNAAAIVLIANPPTIAPGETAQLQWYGANIERCEASDGWSGHRAIEGGETTGSITTTTNYVLTCQSGSSEARNSATVWVTNADQPPTVSLSATPPQINSGTATTLTWTTTDADSCVASGSWNGLRPVVGSASTGTLEQTSQFTLNCSGPGGSASDSVIVSVDGVQAPPATFTRLTIDQDQAPWGKNLADVDGDGALDILEGGGALGGNVFWYRAPTWQKFHIGSLGGGDDLQAGDINGDGAIDLVVNRDPIGWYENPMGSGGSPEDTWELHTIGDYRSHDIEIVDMNNDDKLDIVIRIAGDTFHTARVIFQGNTADDWTTVGLSNAEVGTGGLATADIDNDGYRDVVSDGYWLRHPPQNPTSGSAWLKYPIGSWPAGSSIDTADLNGDGNVDVTLAVSEVGVGNMAWFEAPDNPLTQPWIRHTIGTVEDVHRHHLVDMNNDGQLDIVFAEMHQSTTDRVGIYYNDGNAESWSLQVIETHASHNIAVGDIGNDGDMDILGANWQLIAPEDGDVFLWINGIN